MQRIFKILAYAGTTPFILCTICIVFGVNIPLNKVNFAQILGNYSLVITSFIAGSHWSLCLISKKKYYFLIIMSNIIAITLWSCSILLNAKFFFIILIMVFSALLLMDRKFLKLKLIPSPYFQLRSVATIIAILTLAVSCFYV